jgi:adenine-specific DNA-methyltransferase
VAATPKGPTDVQAADYRYARARRKNNPPAGLAAEGRIAERQPETYFYNPHLPPALRFDPTGVPDKLPDLLAEARRRPLTDDEVALLAAALRSQEPWLEWTGKREKRALEVDP